HIFLFSMLGRWLKSVALSGVMLFSVAGVGAQEHEGSCPMSNLPDCCKKAQSSAPEASIARVCCNLNCSEPGSTGSSSSSTFSTPQYASANAAVSGALINSKIVFTSHILRFRPHDSNPRYIKHLALLI